MEVDVEDSPSNNRTTATTSIPSTSPATISFPFNFSATKTASLSSTTGSETVLSQSLAQPSLGFNFAVQGEKKEENDEEVEDVVVVR